VNNNAIRTALMNLDFNGSSDIFHLLETSYECLMSEGWVGKEEEALLATWTSDLKKLG